MSEHEKQNVQVVDPKLLVALKRFQGQEENDDDERRCLWMHNVHWNRATLLRLAAFLGSTSSRPVQELSLSTCEFDDDKALTLFCSFISNNAFPKTLEKLHLERCRMVRGQENGSYDFERRLLDSFHTNATIKVLSLFGSNSSSSSSLQGATGGAAVAALLTSPRRNSTLTTIDLGWSFHDVAFVKALREGILTAAASSDSSNSDGRGFTSCCCHLQSIGLHRSSGMDAETMFDKLQLGFTKTKATGQGTTTTTTSCLVNLCHCSFDRNDAATSTTTLIQLRHLLLTMPGLKDLDVANNWLDIAPHALLFQQQQQQQQPQPQTQMPPRRRRQQQQLLQLEKVNLTNCGIDHVRLARMAAAAIAAAPPAAAAGASVAIMPGDGGNDDDSSSSRRLGLLRELNLSCNKIHGRRGGESLACFLMSAAGSSSCKIETLILSGNAAFGAIGARALAPALMVNNNNHGCQWLQRLDLSSCRIQDGAISILASLTSSSKSSSSPDITTTAARPCCLLRALDLSDNRLPPDALVAVAEYLQHASSRHLQELHLSDNANLFKSFHTCSSSNKDPVGCSFFDALAHHKAMQILHLCNVGMNEVQTEQPLLSALLHNTVLLQVEHTMSSFRVQHVTMEYTRRNHLFANMNRTMMDAPCISIPYAFWPMALHVCSPRSKQEVTIGPTMAFCLVQKVMECSVFSSHG
jgi:Leucine Rich repeat